MLQLANIPEQDVVARETGEVGCGAFDSPLQSLPAPSYISEIHNLSTRGRRWS